MTLGREVDDGEPSMSERDTGFGVDPRTAVIGTTVNHPSRHPRDDSEEVVAIRRRAAVNEARDTAHF